MSQTQPDTVPVAASTQTLTGHALSDAPAHVDQLHPGIMVGPYRLLRPLGRGGMGEVWLAEQTAPLKREVAIKLLARRINDRMAEAWFLVERQALAMLVHPYIAQIYDAGQLPGGGAMFFAMEYIEGTTLDRWVSQRSPSLGAVVELLERICTGIQHAHQRGLIHRDLKPANLLVRDDGQVALPKIIDFGVAVGGVPGQQVQIDQKVTIGTAAYMAPEQAKPTADGIDARADVYALGATLANILCSRAGLQIEVQQALSHVAASLTRTGAHDIGDAPTKPALHALRKSIPKELRAIAVKAMAADREQRYESAAALGADLQRWRLGKPVLAMGGGRVYAVRCFLRRYRWASAAAAVAVLALVVGIGAALYGLGQARQAQSVAEQRRVQAEDLVSVMLDDLADRLRPLGQLELLETVGDEALRYLSAAAHTDGEQSGALHRARALRTLGEVYMSRNLTDKARLALAEAASALNGVEESDEDPFELAYESGKAAYLVGYLAFQSEDYDGAEVHWQQYLELAQRQQALRPSDLALIETAQAQHNLASVSLRKGNTQAAIERFRQSIDLKRQALRITDGDGQFYRIALANSISSFGSTLLAQGQPREALRYFEEQVSVLAEESDRSPEWHKRMGVALRLKARLQFEISGADASQTMTAAVAELRAAASTDQGNRAWARSLFAAQSDYAWMRFMVGENQQALALLRSAIDDHGRPDTANFDTRARDTMCRALTRVGLIAAIVADETTLDDALSQLDRLLSLPPFDWAQSDFAHRELATRELALAVRAKRDNDTEAVNEHAQRALDRLGDPDQVTDLGELSLIALGARLQQSEQLIAATLRRADALGYDARATRRVLSQL